MDTSNDKVWLIAGAGRGMGADFAKAALVTIVDQKTPPRRFIAGADAVATADPVAADLKAQTAGLREPSSSLGFEE